MAPEVIDHQKIYSRRIDILKRLGKKVEARARVDDEKYIVLPHGQVIRRETLRQKHVFVNGQLVRDERGE